VTPPSTAISIEDTYPEPLIVLREGDNLRISFPGSATLDSIQAIRRDGKVVLPVFGELTAAGLTPAQLEKTILANFGEQLVTKEVHVTLQSSTFPVYVNGAVLRPGKVESNRPITALAAIMECGGFDYARANLGSVKVIRTEGSDVKNYQLDFRGVLKGNPSKPFYLKPSDIVFVPEKFTVF
jgi:polysaccharide export outer membrane protein